jgi:hypothetical protein
MSKPASAVPARNRNIHLIISAFMACMSARNSPRIGMHLCPKVAA